MATKNFKGFQLVTKAQFEALGKKQDLNTLYFVRTNEAKSDGFLYFNNKKYGTAEDAKKALTDKYGELSGMTISVYVAGEIKKAVEDAKTALVGAEDTVDTIKHAEKLATDASNKVDTEIGKLDVAGNVSEAVKGVTVTVDETDGKVIKPVVSIADGTLTGAATDANLVTGTVVKKYVDDKVSDINTSANALGERVGTLETKVGSEAAGEEAATGLFKKIADEASTARAAEKKNADAIAAETTRATAAEEKVKTDLLGGATDDYNTLGKLETKIKAAQSAADKVSGVKSGDKVISLGADGKLSSTISLSVDTDADGKGKKYIRLKGIDGADLGKIDTADFVKDGMLNSAELVTNPSGQTEGTYIKLTWNTDSGKEDDPMYINVTSLIDTYTAKANGGLVLEDKAFSVDTTKIATVASVNDVTSRVSTLEGEVADNKAAIEAETTRAQGAEKANADAIDILNGDSGVTGSVAQKIKAALEAGAVTLEVKDNDAYLGVSATTEGKGTVYTLASKEAKIKEDIKAEADKVKVSVTNGTYVKGSVDEATGRVITLSEKVQAVADADANFAEKKGLAEASDVKNYVDTKVRDKNVSATGDTYVSASADANKVTVAATEALTTAVAKANSAVQSVNGLSGTAVTLKATDIEVGAGVSGQTETAKVNAVLADIYDKLGVAVKADEKTIKEGADHTLSVNLEAKTDTTVANGHVALTHGNDGALYGVMYYSGDDIDA